MSCSLDTASALAKLGPEFNLYTKCASGPCVLLGAGEQQPSNPSISVLNKTLRPEDDPDIPHKGKLDMDTLRFTSGCCEPVLNLKQGVVHGSIGCGCACHAGCASAHMYVLRSTALPLVCCQHFCSSDPTCGGAFPDPSAGLAASTAANIKTLNKYTNNRLNSTLVTTGGKVRSSSTLPYNASNMAASESSVFCAGSLQPINLAGMATSPALDSQELMGTHTS